MRDETARSTRKRSTAPTPPSTMTPAHTATVVIGGIRTRPHQRRGGVQREQARGDAGGGVADGQAVVTVLEHPSVSTCMVENVVSPPHSPVPSSGRR